MAADAAEEAAREPLPMQSLATGKEMQVEFVLAAAALYDPSLPFACTTDFACG